MRALLAALALLLVAAPAAHAHAVLEETSPPRGAQVDASPPNVSFRFNEPVEGAFGSIRVFDADGRRVDDSKTFRPGNDSNAIGVGLEPDLPDGQYVATYRVVSADAHPISGGFTFQVGAGGSKAAPAVSDLVGDGAGPVTQGAFGIARGVTYAATALLLGGLLFLLLVWRRAAPPASAAAAFHRRARTIGLYAALAGLVAGIAGIVLQGATGAGITFWSALDLDVVGEVLETRFGRVWLLRDIAFAILAVALLLWRPVRARQPAEEQGDQPRRRAMATAGTHLFTGVPLPAGGGLLVVAVAAGFLAFAPAFAGHAATAEPVAVLFPADVIHVAAMSLWLGGLAALLLAVPAATRAIDPDARSRLLAGLLLRFSPLALACVLLLLATGLVQSILHIEELGALVDTAFGRAVLVKIALMIGLIALGVVQRRRIMPRLRQAATAHESPGDAGRLLHSTLRGEIVLALGVLAATSALVAYPPPDSLAAGPFSASKPLGAQTLEVTLDPASVGRNELHLYLLDAKTGAPFTGTREFRVSTSLPSQDIGPIPAEPRRAGPGHYVVDGLDLVPKGEWHIDVVNRVSEFEAGTAEIVVDIE